MERTKQVTTLAEAISRMHKAGLDRRYDDILETRYAEGADAVEMGRGCHYDYAAQAWVDGHDHAHIVSNDDAAPMLFCGANLANCCPEAVAK